MKCPKCRYLSFEPELRCKHCGYDLSLADASLPLRSFDELEQQNPDTPLADVQLRDAAAVARHELDRAIEMENDAPRPRSIGAARVRSESSPEAASAVRWGGAALAERDRPAPARPAALPIVPARARLASSQPTPDLPLFIKGLPAGESAASRVPSPALSSALKQAAPPAPPIAAPIAPAVAAPIAPAVAAPILAAATAVPDATADPAADDTDAVAVPAAPRPLAVRRRAPDSGRIMATLPLSAPGSASPAAAPAPVIVSRADRDVLAYVRRVEVDAAPAVAPATEAGSIRHDAARRFKAAGVDGLMLLAMNATVSFLTMRQCGLDLDQIAQLPRLPLATFLVGISLTYLLVFTIAGGQTIGKMMYGLRVVGEDDDAGAGLAPTARQLSYRALLSVASVLLLGLGFLPALLGDGRALHDRLTHTRLVRV